MKMHVDDINTVELKRVPAGTFQKAWELEWLHYLGFTDEELEKDGVQIVIQADYSKKHKQPFIGIAKKK